MKLYVIRHGETQWNREHILQGQLDSPLTKNGTGGARKIKKALEHIEFKKVYTSQQKRAIETAEIILEDRKNSKYTIDADISEMSYGSWQGKSQEEICQDPKSAEMYRNYFRHPEKYVPVSGGEGFADIVKRAEHFLAKLREEHEDGDSLMAITHGTLIKALFAVVKNLSLEDFWEKPHVTNGSISIFEISKEGVGIILEADTSHLGEHEVTISESDYLK